MIKFSNKKSVIYLIVFLCLIFIAGCSHGKKATTNKNNSDNKTTTSDNTTTVDNNKSEDTSDNNSSSDNSNTQKSDSNSSGSNEEDDVQKTLLEKINKLANSGKIINCDFAAQYTNMEDVEDKWGEADKTEWISKAKGTYATYAKHDVVFGFNKGEQIFEARTFDKELSKLSLGSVKKYYGTPAYKAESGDDEIIGYVINKDFKILFVFPKDKGDDAVLNHYSVFYPHGTVNYMSGDMGREW